MQCYPRMLTADSQLQRSLMNFQLQNFQLYKTGPSGNSEFCFPTIRLGNIEILGKQN